MKKFLVSGYGAFTRQWVAFLIVATTKGDAEAIANRSGRLDEIVSVIEL